MASLLGIVLIVIFLSFILVYINTPPPKYPLHIPPSMFKADYENFAFVGRDGTVLNGWLIRPVAARTVAGSASMVFPWVDLQQSLRQRNRTASVPLLQTAFSRD
jgi:hypothetical protein